MYTEIQETMETPNPSKVICKTQKKQLFNRDLKNDHCFSLLNQK